MLMVMFRESNVNYFSVFLYTSKRSQIKSANPPLQVKISLEGLEDNWGRESIDNLPVHK